MVAQNIVTLISQVLASIICAYWTFKINQFLRSLCPRKKMSCIGNFRRNFTTLNQTTGYIKFNSYYHLLHQGIVFSVSQVAFKVTPETNFMISMITDFLYINIFHGITFTSKIKIPPKDASIRPLGSISAQKPQSLEARGEKNELKNKLIVVKLPQAIYVKPRGVS